MQNVFFSFVSLGDSEGEEQTSVDGSGNVWPISEGCEEHLIFKYTRVISPSLASNFSQPRMKRIELPYLPPLSPLLLLSSSMLYLPHILFSSCLTITLLVCPSTIAIIIREGRWHKSYIKQYI